MKSIITFISAVKRCKTNDYYDYNGYHVIYDEDRFIGDLSSLCDNAIEALIVNRELNLNIIWKLIMEADETIDKNTQLIRSQRFADDTHKNRVLYFLNEQKRNLDRFRGFLGALGIGTADNIAAPAPHAEESTAANANAIEGVAGLAKYLGCGMNKAQDICNSGLLKKNGIQYSVGRKWIFNRKKIETYLAANPEAFARVRRRKKSVHFLVYVKKKNAVSC